MPTSESPDRYRNVQTVLFVPLLTVGIGVAGWTAKTSADTRTSVKALTERMNQWESLVKSKDELQQEREKRSEVQLGYIVERLQKVESTLDKTREEMRHPGATRSRAR